MTSSKSVLEPVRIELPFPPSDLNPNRSRRLHWSKRAKVVREYRNDCGWTARAEWREYTVRYGVLAKPALTPPVEAIVTFVVPDRRRRDLDNLLAMLKPAWDGLFDAGVLAGDDAERFKVRDVFLQWDGEPKVIVELRSVATVTTVSGAGTT